MRSSEAVRLELEADATSVRANQKTNSALRHLDWGPRHRRVSVARVGPVGRRRGDMSWLI